MDEQQHHQHQQQHQTDLTFHNPDWSINKSPQPSFIPHRDDLYSPMGGAPPYSTYDNYENFSDDMTNTINQGNTVYEPTMSWSTTDDNQMVSMMATASTPTTKLTNQFSSDFFINNKKPQLSHSQNLMNIFPLPPLPPHHQIAMNMFGQRPNHGTPYINKGDKYHPRFKSANARLSPFTEQQEMYQQFLSSSSSSSPPQQSHLVKHEEMTVVEEENNINELSTSMDQHQQYYQAYQDEKEYGSVSTEKT